VIKDEIETVYLAGWVGNYATYWKNGELVYLSDGTTE
jgi:hypothetical protein